ncbi:MAG: PrsW family intramembrane metalloprotease [Polyangiaceae bacterium]|jgi:RsiW-degrading membrane proteinase PrsW (M82 family)|nr:PrsW family intramembrane metalloprotease [Polyangiaceae bacterium]
MVPSNASEKNRRMLGAALWSLGVLVGGLLLLFLFVIAPLMDRGPSAIVSMFFASLLAFPAVLVYLWVPVLVDRYDPEPWWCLAMAFIWGAIPACGFSAVINTAISSVGGAVAGAAGSTIAGAVISAPIFEEAFKGMAVLGMFWFLRREFDGVVDGVIYATFAALGFAAVENVVYYARSLQSGGEVGLAVTFVMRGVLSPWGHPLYTSMTGLGVGIARETNKGWLKICAPIGGYCAAVFLHSLWNGSAFLSSAMDFPLFLVMLPLWFLFVAAFGAIVIALVVREGRIIRMFLQDEVLIGNLSQQEVDLVCSPLGRLKSSLAGRGKRGRRFIDAASRLALSKWHATRAMQGQKRTISADFIAPLRQELQRLRHEMYHGGGGVR